jgi:hypothetical protein
MDLSAGRLRDLLDQVRAEQSFIICHDTLPHHRYPDAKPAICRGFYQRYTTHTLRLIQRLWGFTEVDPPCGCRQPRPQPLTCSFAGGCGRA